eukprot:UN31833
MRDCPEYECYDFDNEIDCENPCGDTECYWHDNLVGCLHEGEHIAHISVRLEPIIDLQNTKTVSTVDYYKNVLSNLSTEEFTTSAGFENVITESTTILDETSTVEHSGNEVSYNSFVENAQTQLEEQTGTSQNEVEITAEMGIKMTNKAGVDIKAFTAE